MPTPFYHLSLAQEMLIAHRLPGAIRRFLQSLRGEFMFGNAAPDVQVVSGQAREVTHFFSLPIHKGDRPAWENMLSIHPQLANPRKLGRQRAAFIAGYLCHLQADWVWVRDIFAPIFGPTCAWGNFEQRLYYHNILRAYLDLRIPGSLAPGMEACLGCVAPDHWLPFVDDDCLEEWRDFIARQLRPGEAIQTVEVFSSRQGISAPEFYALLESESRMQQEVFNHISLDMVKRYNQRVLEENARLLTKYLAFTLHPTAMTVEGSVFRGVQP